MFKVDREFCYCAFLLRIKIIQIVLLLLLSLVSIWPGFHYTTTATTKTLEIGRCRGRNWFNGNQAFTVTTTQKTKRFCG